jgi:FMN phosphatase YigB (HAD superfamily)
MLRAVVFDLFETLITESRTRPPGVSSLAPALGCERQSFREEWKAVRPAVMAGRVSFRQALRDITARLGRPADESVLQRMCDDRVRTKEEPFAQIEPEILAMLERLGRRDVRFAVLSNCCAEDVCAWPRSALASYFECTVFSFEAALAKPDPEIYREATRRLRVDASEAWYIGDGADDELSGAEQAGLRAFRAVWFLKRWPHFRDEPCAVSSVASTDDFASLVEQTTAPFGPRDRTRRHSNVDSYNE